MSLNRNREFRGVFSFPRVSGDEPISAALVSCQLEFSPRERG